MIFKEYFRLFNISAIIFALKEKKQKRKKSLLFLPLLHLYHCLNFEDYIGMLFQT